MKYLEFIGSLAVEFYKKTEKHASFLHSQNYCHNMFPEYLNESKPKFIIQQKLYLKHLFKIAICIELRQTILLNIIQSYC